MKRTKYRKVMTFAAAGIVLLAGLVYAMVKVYTTYMQTVIAQEQYNLLIISRAVSQSIELYLMEQRMNVDTLIRTPGFASAMEEYYQTGEGRSAKEYILSNFLPHHRGYTQVFLVDKSGSCIFVYDRMPFLEEYDVSVLDFKGVTQTQQTGLGNPFQVRKGHFAVPMVNSIYGEDGYMGAVVGIIDLEQMYQDYIGSLNVWDEGYVMVKDSSGVIIMHPSGELLSYNQWTGMEDPSLQRQYADQWEYLNNQYTYEEGTAVYTPYWGAIMRSQKELSAFSRMNMDSSMWYVSVSLPYSEVAFDLNLNLSNFTLLVIAIAVLLGGSLYVILHLQRNHQELERETEYLKDINRTLEELQQSREQVRHFQKLTTIGALTGGIAHEFNNLLTPILGYSELLKSQLGQENPYYEDMDEIHKAGMRAKEIIEQILPFSRRETDSKEHTTVRLDTVIRDVAKTIKIVLPEKIQMVTEISTPGLCVYGSATQLHQVLLNLCTNGYQAMEEQGGRLTIRCAKVGQEQLPEILRDSAADHSYVCIEVSDTGCGMEETVLEQMFEPFFTTKQVGDGTGLGLSVVQNILISHGGVIEAKSVVGSGSSFYVYLPLPDGQ